MKFVRASLVSVALVGGSVHAQTIEFSQLPFASLRAPLAVAPFNTSYFPTTGITFWHSSLVSWGYGAPGNVVIPYIGFAVDDYLGVAKSCSNNTAFPKHLGNDYAGSAGMSVYAIADGTVVRIGSYNSSGVGNHYVVVQSGIIDKWTVLYGHMNAPQVQVGSSITKGSILGTLYNYTDYGDRPHLHLGIRRGAYDGTGSANRGIACAEDTTYQTNKYNFVNPSQYSYYTPYWGG